MPQWTISRTVIHPSPWDRLDQGPMRLLKVALWLTVLLWSGGILAFIVLHILQAMTLQHVTIPDLSDILLLPPLISLLFYVGRWATLGEGREIRLKVFGREVIGVPVPEAGRSVYLGEGEYKGFTDIEFQAPNGVRHRIEVEGQWTERSVLLRYDPFDFSNAKVISSPKPRRHPIQTLLGGVSYCGCLLVSIAILGGSIIFLAVFVLAFFIPTTPPHP